MRLLIAAITLALASCASVQTTALNDLGRSQTLPGTSEPHEIADGTGVAAGYTLTFAKGQRMSGYRLTLTFKNTSTTNMSIAPRVSVIDSNGRILNPGDYESFVAAASALAGAPPPVMPTFGPDYYRTSGTVTSMQTGNQYRYSGTTTPVGGFASGFSQGAAMGAAINAARERDEGKSHLQWAGANWLRSSYEIPPGAIALGVLFIPAQAAPAGPVTVSVDVNGQTFRFKTAQR